MRSFAAKAQALLKRFRKDEDGAMTVEWVAIASAVVVGAVAITYAVLENLDPVAATVGDLLTGVADDVPDAPPTFGDGQVGTGRLSGHPTDLGRARARRNSRPEQSPSRPSRGTRPDGTPQGPAKMQHKAGLLRAILKRFWQERERRDDRRVGRHRRRRYCRRRGFDLGCARQSDLGLGAAGPAREAFASLAANEPVRTRALQGLGLANLRLGDRDAALAALESATEADPKLWRAWVGLARLHDGKGEWDLATKAYDQALATAPDRGLVLNNRGVSMMARGEPAEAAKQFEQALQVRPDLATAKANLRLALAMAGHDGDILAAAGTEELPQVLNNLGFIAMVQGDLPRAESYFYRAIEASPTFYQRAYDNLQRLDQLRERDTSHVVL